eukprot:4233646-Pyramimonas_sp.AAC.1
MQRVRDEPSDLDHLVRITSQLGYSVRYGLLGAETYGSPTCRQRLYVVGIQATSKFGNGEQM